MSNFEATYIGYELTITFALKIVFEKVRGNVTYEIRHVKKFHIVFVDAVAAT